MIEQRSRTRLLVVVLLLLTAVAGVSARLAYLHFQIGPGVDRGLRITAMRRFQERVAVSRGRILDANGAVLALDVTGQQLCADPRQVHAATGVLAVCATLGRVLNIEPAVLAERFAPPDRQFVYVCGYGQTLAEAQARAVAGADLPGVFLRETMVRTYPRGTSLCHVLGYVNLDPERRGSAGIELRWDRFLRGVPGLLVGERDGRRREMYDRRMLDIRPRPGASVTLTVDQYVQYVVERALDQAVREQQASAAWAIVERVRTGEILAMASTPVYDPAAFRAAPPDAMRNRAIATVYEPGSTFKVAIVAAALNENVVAPSDVYDCENGMWFYQRRPLHDFHPYGLLSVADIIKKSSNIGAAKIALKLGNARLYSYLQAFGFGAPTGIELPGEEGGLLAPPDRWSGLTPTRVAIGHEVAVTALQMLGALCAIANDGVLMKPQIVRRVADAEGRVLYQFAPKPVRQVLKPQAARVMNHLLVRVTEEGGTGTRARVDGYTVGGKTGTAQKAIPGGYSDTLNMSSFMGFLPAEDPDVALIVVLDEPKTAVRTGGYVAGPVFREIAEQVVRYLDIPPQPPSSVLAAGPARPAGSRALSL